MLRSLTLRDVVFIEHAEIEINEGFTVITGDTGAGKSLIIQALALALGVKSSKIVVNKDKVAKISAVFEEPYKPLVLDLLAKNGISVIGQIILRRHLGHNWSRSYINDEQVSLDFLKKIGGLLVEMEGQFSVHNLFDVSSHRDILDSFASHGKKTKKVNDLWHLRSSLRLDLSKLEEEYEELRQEEEHIRFVLEEIKSLSVKIGELDDLASRREQGRNRELILSNIKMACDYLSDDEEANICQNLSKVLFSLEKILPKVSSRNQLSSCHKQLREAYLTIKEASVSLASIFSSIGESEEDLSMIEERYFAIKDLCRKYNCSADELSLFCREQEGKLSRIEASGQALQSMRNRFKEADLSYISAVKDLRLGREKAAAILDKKIASQLGSIKLGYATFKTEITHKEYNKWSKLGGETISFKVSTNKAQPLRELSKVASGGELSRFMLALRIVTAATNKPYILIFDEIDRGLGGATASALGYRLRELSDSGQVLVITHSAQVASIADYHLRVEKISDSKISISSLCGDKRLEELARMISGRMISDEARAAAIALLAERKEAVNNRQASG